jgi:hypothetical protein
MKSITLMGILALGLLLCVSAVLALQPQTPPATNPVTDPFTAVDIWVDSGRQALGAYQFELTLERGKGEIVGLEGGEHPAFTQPPYYDPAALSGQRIIVAAYQVAAPLPTGKTRVARVHLQLHGEIKPQYVVKLIASCGATGETIPATAGAQETLQGDRQ